MPVTRSGAKAAEAEARFAAARRGLRLLLVAMMCVVAPLMLRVLAYAPDGIDAAAAEAQGAPAVAHPIVISASDGEEEAPEQAGAGGGGGAPSSSSDGAWWGQPTATVQWCEQDYAVVPWAAEFWSTTSSLIIVAHGVWGLLAHRRSGGGGDGGGGSTGKRSGSVLGPPLLEWRFVWSFIAFIVIGLGSAAFHATLWRSMQLLDELPMIWGNSVFVYILAAMEDPLARGPRRGLALGLAVFTALLTLSTALFDEQDQNIFLIAYGSGVIYVFWRTLAIDRVYNSKPAAEGTAGFGLRRSLLMDMSAVSYIGGLLLWLLDRNFCYQLRFMHFHAWWHFGASFGTFCAVLNWMYIRHIILGRRPAVEGVLPFQRIVSSPRVASD